MTWIYLGSIQKDIIHAYCKASLSWCINWKRKGRTSCRLREVLVSRSKQYESICALTATMQLQRLVALGIPIWVGSANTCFSVSIGFRSWERGACWITPATGSECKGTHKRFSFGHELVIDVVRLQFPGMSDKWDAYSIGYAVLLGAAYI